MKTTVKLSPDRAVSVENSARGSHVYMQLPHKDKDGNNLFLFLTVDQAAVLASGLLSCAERAETLAGYVKKYEAKAA